MAHLARNAGDERSVIERRTLPVELGRPADPFAALGDDEPLDEDEARYAHAARADNTLRGYRSDWEDWTAWCATHGHRPMPASPTAVARYLTYLAAQGAKVGTMSRRRSALRFAHQLANLPSPTATARVEVVWEGIRRTHGAPPDQSAPLEPPALFDVLDACPTEKVWRTRGRPPEPSLAGARDRALLMVGFVGAFRRVELSAIDVEHIAPHPRGRVIAAPRSKENQTGLEPELVVLPYSASPARCPVRLLDAWLELADITNGAVFRGITKSNKVRDQRLHPESVNDIVQAAVARAGIDSDPYSAHSLRAGFVTHSHRRGASDRAIAHQTRHRSLESVGQYVRIDEAWDDNAATQLGF